MYIYIHVINRLYISMYMYINTCACIYMNIYFGLLVAYVYGISTFVGYLPPTPCKLFYFKQFSLVLVHSLIVKNISISSYSV